MLSKNLESRIPWFIISLKLHFWGIPVYHGMPIAGHTQILIQISSWCSVNMALSLKFWCSLRRFRSNMATVTSESIRFLGGSHWCLKIGCSSLGVKLQVDLDWFIFPRSRRLRGKNDEIQLELLGLKNQCYQTQNMCTAIFTGRAMGRPSVIQYDARKCDMLMAL